MKVVFLDFDGVLNSAASFLLEGRIREENKIFDDLCPVNETLCRVCTSNFRTLLEHFPQLKIVISSSWRNLFELEWLKAKLSEYKIDPERVIDKTPDLKWKDRGEEIQAWLKEHPEITKYVVLDDNFIGGGIPDEQIVKTSWNVGLTLKQVEEAAKKLGGRFPTDRFYLEKE